MTPRLFATLLAAIALGAGATEPDRFEAKRAPTERIDQVVGRGVIDPASEPGAVQGVGNQVGTLPAAAQQLGVQSRGAVESSVNATTAAQQVIQSNVRVNVGR